MSTSFKVISLGVWSSLDPTEGNAIAENLGTLTGQTFGSIDDPLANHVKNLTPGSYSGGDPTTYESDNFWANDTFSINGGALQTYDVAVPFTATVTYADGTTASLTRLSLMQDTAGNLYILPSKTADSDLLALEAKPIQSITLGSYIPSGSPDAGWNMTADRDPWDGILTKDGIVQGTTGNDSIGAGYADGGGDLIDGADGDNDTVRAGTGNDTIASGAGNDVVLAGSGDDIADLGTGNDTFGDLNDWSTEAGNDSVHGGTGNDVLIGGGGNDTLHGDDGDDSLSGAWGADWVYGDAGNDVFVVSDGQETDTIDGGTDIDTLLFWNFNQNSGVSASYTGSGAGTWSYNASDHGVFSNIEILSGTGYADTVNATLDAAGTVVYGNAGNDSITGGSGADTLDGGADSDTLDGGGGNDLMDGGAGDDSLVGGTGNDTLTGGAGADTLAGGNGLDFANYQASGAGVNVNLLTNTASGGDAQGDVISGIDGVYGSAYGDTLTGHDWTSTLYGGAGNDVLTGGAGNGDQLFGEAGNDTLAGGAGADSLSGGDGDDRIVLGTGFGNDTIDAGEAGETLGDTLDGSGLSSGVTLTFTGSESGTVSSGSDSASFTGVEKVLLGTGNDTLIGSTGAESVAGGDGSDSLSGGAGNDTLSGDAGADVLNGGTGNDSLSGGADSDSFGIAITDGTDTILGGETGYDYDQITFTTSVAGSGVTVTYSGSEAGTYSFSGGGSGSFSQIEAITGTTNADTIDASASASSVTLAGGGGNDVLTGGSGADHFKGDDGNDTIIGNLGNDTLNGDAGNDVLDGGAGDDWLLGGSGDNTLTGGDGNDYFNGYSGSNLVSGGAGSDTILVGDGADTIDGGTGADSIQSGSGSDRIVLTAGFGNDTILAGETDDLAGDTLDGSALATGTTLIMTGPEAGTLSDGTSTASFSQVEKVILGSGADSASASGLTEGVNIDTGAGNDTFAGGTGNDTFSGSDGDDVAAGSGGDDVLSGGTGNDTLNGGIGNDSLSGGDGNDQLNAGDGNDTVSGGLGNDTLLGGAGNDSLAGDAGNDSLTGGTGNDTLGLGLGSDTVVFADGDGADVILDFDATVDPTTGRTNDQFDTSGLTTGTGAPVTVKDVTLADDGLGNAVLIFPQGESITLVGVPFADLSLTKVQTLHAMGIPCFVSGCRIDTPDGFVAVEDLRPGHLVRVRDGPPQPVIWAASRRFTAADMQRDPRLLPVEIRAGAFGNPLPVRLSSQHCVLVPEGSGRLVRARHLVACGWKGARLMAGKAGCTYHHILLPRHALVRVDGLWAESFWPGPIGFSALDSRSGMTLIRAFPALASALFGQVPVESAYSPRAAELLPRRMVSQAACTAWARSLQERPQMPGPVTPAPRL